MALLVREKRRAPNHEMRFWGTLRAMPRAYRSFLLAVGVFGIADFAPTVMILRAAKRGRQKKHNHPAMDIFFLRRGEG
jgi:hypothetical protein